VDRAGGEVTRRAASAAGGVLAIAAQLDLVSRLLAVITAVLAMGSLRLDHAIACRVGALDRWGHLTPPCRIYAWVAGMTSSAA
jgi:hypothetical protein